MRRAVGETETRVEEVRGGLEGGHAEGRRRVEEGRRRVEEGTRRVEEGRPRVQEGTPGRRRVDS